MGPDFLDLMDNGHKKGIIIADKVDKLCTDAGLFRVPAFAHRGQLKVVGYAVTLLMTHDEREEQEDGTRYKRESGDLPRDLIRHSSKCFPRALRVLHGAC